MSAFVALNIESDEESEEVDDTKEIQIEEALKLYLTALKLHSQGPEYYSDAKGAYDSLFKSEIFKYPESLSEYERAQRYDPEHQDIYALEDTSTGTTRPRESREGTASALPQTIYLTYKNHGQFLLDSLKHAQSSADPITSSRSALRAFAEALERDDSDLELWRKSARVGDALRSYRIARYCLESVVDGARDKPDDYQFDQLGLEQAFAVEDLRRIVYRLFDRLSMAKLPLKRPRRVILQLLKAGVDPFPFLPSTLNDDSVSIATQNILGPGPSHVVIRPAAPNWVDLGNAILEALTGDIEGQTQSGSTVEISLLSNNDNPADSLSLPIIQRETLPETRYPEHSEVRSSATVINDNIAVEIFNAPCTSKKAENLSKGDAVEEGGSAPDEPHTEMPGEQRQAHPPNTAEEVDAKTSPVETRKRSSTSAGNDEPADGGRTKSRRIRARESNAETIAQPEEISVDHTRYFEDRLETFMHADQWMFGTVGGLLSKLGVEDLGTIDELKQALFPPEQRRPSTEHYMSMVDESVVFHDLRHTIETWDDAKAQAVLHSDIFSAAQDGSGAVKASALAIFLEHSRQASQPSGENTTFHQDDGLTQFCEHINLGKYPAQDVAFEWLERHLVTKDFSIDSPSSDDRNATSSYATQQWPDPMKEAVNQVVLKIDEFLYRRLLNSAAQLEKEILSSGPREDSSPRSCHLSSVEFSQTLYELHLNIYGAMTAPNNDNDESAICVQRDRLSRWRSITRSLLNHHMDIFDDYGSQTVTALRHLWATTLHLNMVEDADQEHVLVCLEDLKQALVCFRSPVITLLNNETMPEISVAAVEKEVSRLKSKEFFMDIFGAGANDPVHLIESIEPILDPAAIEYAESPEDMLDETNAAVEPHDTQQLVSRAQEMASFLDRGDPTLKLFLWRRLQEAYDSIQYPTKSISCRLRSLETIVQELGKPAYVEPPSDQRQAMLLKWLKVIDKLLGKLVGQILDAPETAFECFDMSHLRSSMSTMARLSKLLHSFAMFEDAVRVGQIQHPDIRPASTAKSLEQFKERLRGMQVNAWIIQYALLREGIDQNKELFDTPFDDRVHYLRSVHNALGIRAYCKCSNKLFLKLMKEELLTLQTEDGYESDISQVLFDLYGLKFSPNLDSLDHSCPIERLDRSTALMMIDFVMLQANQLNIKDLPKSELKSTMDIVQKSAGWPSKSVPALAINKRVLSSFLKSPINPAILFRAVRGIGDVSMVPVSADFANLAKKGWYFLLGSSALAKFRAQKRLGPTPTEDLDLAASFFKVDIELGSGKWETWYRLAQVYDLKLEEDIAWSADKLNNHRADLATLQRKGIHSYTMAVAQAIRDADSTIEAKRMLSDLYTEFGFRIYTSSKEPLSMETFRLGSTRHFSDCENQQYTGKPFSEMTAYSAEKYASYLFRRAMVDRPRYWVNHYMFSKCLWKMFNYEQPERSERSVRTIEVDDVLDSLTDSIDSLPSKKEPILEPHFKLVSVIHKLVKRELLHPKEASEKLCATQWAKNLTPVDQMESWKPFVLEVLKNLRKADKSNWHHRIVARTAHVIYDDTQDAASALAAKNEFTQHVFTKAMTLQVWRPENERGGRHFVYTARYASFFTQLLDQLNDRANLELLLRRVRKKPHDYLNHGKLWEELCSTYIKLFRRVAKIPEGHEEAIFKPVTHDDFISYAARLEAWCQAPNADSGAVDLLRDAVDMKKLNAGLMKPAIFEDLVADIYAVLYEKNIAKFMEQANEEENRERMKVDRVLMAGDDVEGSRATTTSAQAPGPKARTKGVTRKELQRKADAVATKAMASRQAAKPARTTDEPSRQLPTDGPSEDVAPGKDDVKEAPAVQSSVPASVQDSADDESELSEVNEDKLAEPIKSIAPIFPNLAIKRLSSPKPGSELSTNVSVEGGDGDSGPTASFQDAKSEQARPSDVEMDVDG